jgi:hypothetical protein
MRRYDDPVEVRRGALDERAAEQFPERAPEQFLWRGRLWKVRSVLAHRVETGSWRQGAGDGPAVAGSVAVAPAVTPLRERELWRVRAGRGGLESDGVFDLSFDWTDGSWLLVGCQD